MRRNFLFLEFSRTQCKGEEATGASIHPRATPLIVMGRHEGRLGVPIWGMPWVRITGLFPPKFNTISTHREEGQLGEMNKKMIDLSRI